MIERCRTLLPGVVVLVGGGLVAEVLSRTVLPVSALIVAVGVGIVVSNGVGLGEWATDGVETHKLWLETGIVVMGARVAVDRIVAAGPELLLFVVGFLVFSLVFVEVVGRVVFSIPDRLASLLAAGYSVCGVSAVVAVAGSVRPRSEQLAYAVGAVLLFDALTLLVYPVIGRLLALPDAVFGTWAGVSMVSTGPVVAAGFAYSAEAGQWATVTKLGRNVFIGVVAVVYAVYYTRHDDAADAGGATLSRLWGQFPKFVLGFVAVAAITSAGLLAQADVELLERGYRWLFLFAFVGLGADIDIRGIRRTGARPLLVVLSALVVVSALSLVLSMAVFG